MTESNVHKQAKAAFNHTHTHVSKVKISFVEDVLIGVFCRQNNFLFFFNVQQIR